MGRLPPAETFSLLCRTVAEVMTKNVVSGYNVPILLLMKIVILQRNLAFSHTAADTTTLATYLTETYRSVGVEAVTSLLAAAFQVSADALDISKRVKVCFTSRITLLRVVCRSYVRVSLGRGWFCSADACLQNTS